MLTLRTLAIVITGAAVFACLSLTDAQACDDDRYPCPVRSQQETADAPAETADAPARPAKPQKKVNRPAPPNEKAQAKGEREAPRAPARASKPAVQEPADSISQKAAEAAPAVVPSSRADQPLDESRNESLVATAATAWPVPPNIKGADASAPGVTGVDATEAAKANAAQLVDPNEVNDLDRGAAATAPADSSEVTYLLLILGAALAGALAIWFLANMTSLYARRAANLRMHMSNS